jgi:hypothetical protein
MSSSRIAEGERGVAPDPQSDKEVRRREPDSDDPRVRWPSRQTALATLAAMFEDVQRPTAPPPKFMRPAWALPGPLMVRAAPSSRDDATIRNSCFWEHTRQCARCVKAPNTGAAESAAPSRCNPSFDLPRDVAAVRHASHTPEGSNQFCYQEGIPMEDRSLHDLPTDELGWTFRPRCSSGDGKALLRKAVNLKVVDLMERLGVREFILVTPHTVRVERRR